MRGFFVRCRGLSRNSMTYSFFKQGSLVERPAILGALGPPRTPREPVFQSPHRECGEAAYREWSRLAG